MRIEVEGVGPVEFEDGTPEEVIQQTVRKLTAKNLPIPGPAKLAVGAGEALLQALSGMGGTIAGGLAGIGTGGSADAVRNTQSAMTYQPRTPQGQTIGNAAAYPFELYGKGVKWAGDKVRGDESGGTRDAIATSLEVAAEAAPTLWGGASMLKSARAAKPAPPTLQQRTLAAAQKEGYTVPPSLMGQRSFLEGAGGKARTAQLHSANADKITRDIAAKELGLPKGTELTTDVLERYRQGQYQAGYAPVQHQKIPLNKDAQFRQDVTSLTAEARQILSEFPDAPLPGAEAVSKLADGLLTAENMTPTGTLNYIKKLRSQANKNLAWRATPDEAVESLGRAQKAAANALEGLIERNLEAAGRTTLMERFREARVNIAKSHSIEDALNPATGSVSARDLAKAKNADAFTGSMATARDFGRAFPKATQKPEIFGGTPPIAPLDVSAAQGMGMAGAMLKGDPSGFLAGGIPMLRPLLAPLTKSDFVQRGLVTNKRPTPNFGLTPWGLPFIVPNDEK